MRDWQLARAAFAPVLALGGGHDDRRRDCGTAGDRIGRKSALIASVFLFGVATVGLAAVSGIYGLMIVRFLAGLGLGGAVPNAAALAAEFVPRGSTARRHLDHRVRPARRHARRTARAADTADARLAHPLRDRRSHSHSDRALPRCCACGIASVSGVAPGAMAGAAPIARAMGHVLTKDTRFTQPASAAERAGPRALLLPGWRRDGRAVVRVFSCLLAVYLGFNWVPSMLTGAGLRPEIGSTGITAFNVGGVFGAVAGALTFPRAGSRATMITMVGGAIVSAVAMSALHIAPSNPPSAS